MMIEWNPYPETKPIIFGRYLVSVNVDGDKDTVIDEFCKDTRYDWFNYDDEDITAWAELPEPYEKPVRLKAYPIDEKTPTNKFILFLGQDGAMEIEMLKNIAEGCFTHWSPLPEFDFVEGED